MQFAEKKSFHVVLNNVRNSSWTALITCANFSLETQVYNQNHKEVFKNKTKCQCKQGGV